MHSNPQPDPRRSGFTLIELVVVIAILGIIAGFVIPTLSNVQKTSAEKVSIANQEAVNKSVQTFLAINNGSLDKLDSLIDWSTPILAASAGKFAANNATLNSTTVVGGVFRGVKQVDFVNTAVPSDDLKAQNQGIATDLAGKIIVYYLSDGDITSLKRLGLRNVFYFNPTTLHPNSRGQYTAGMAGSNPKEVVVGGGPGFRPEHSACFQVPLEKGLAVLAIDPLKGLSLYKSFGVPLSTTDATTGLPRDPTTDAEAQAAATGKILLLFGLGQNASIVGHRSGGIDTAPRSETQDYSWYRQYLLVVRLMGGASALNAGAEFAGALDPKGQTVTDARFSNEWRNGDR